VIEYARGNGSADNYYSVISVKDASPTITGCTIRNSTATYGIYVFSGSPTITFQHPVRERPDRDLHLQRFPGNHLEHAQRSHTGSKVCFLRYRHDQPGHPDEHLRQQYRQHISRRGRDHPHGGPVGGVVHDREFPDRRSRGEPCHCLRYGRPVRLECRFSCSRHPDGERCDVHQVGNDQLGRHQPARRFRQQPPGKLRDRVRAGNGSADNYYSVISVKDASPTITGCTIRNSTATYGIYVFSGSRRSPSTPCPGTARPGSTSTAVPGIISNTLSGHTQAVKFASYDTDTTNPVIRTNIYDNNTDNISLAAEGPSARRSSGRSRTRSGIP